MRKVNSLEDTRIESNGYCGPVNVETLSMLDNPLFKKERIELRSYQLKIAESSIGKNTLVILPTALGKTIIAIYVSAYYLCKYPKGKILVMAPTKPLVNQHKERFLQLLNIEDYQVKVLTGEISPEERKLWWSSNNIRIFFATPEVVKNDLETGLNLNEFCLLVFDEAHRARKSYAYTTIAKYYVNQSENPRILGLTASPGGNIDKVREIVNNLFIENIVYRSEYDEDVSPYVHKIKIEYRFVKPPESYERYARLIREILEDYLAELREAGLIPKDYRQITRKELLEIGKNLSEKITTEKDKYSSGLSWNLLILQNTALILLHALELLLSQGAETLKKFLTNSITFEKKSHRRLLKDPRFQALMNMLDEEFEEHSKIKILIDELEKQFNQEPSSRVIVFTQYRDTAEHLADILKARNIKAEVFVGQRKDRDSIYMSQRKQLDILKKFREGSIQVLISTSIGEEGLDIPQCSLVVFYEPIPSEIRFIQRRGRTGRVRTGRCIILVSEGTSDQAYLESAHRKVRRIKQIVEEINKEIKQKSLLEYTNPSNTSDPEKTFNNMNNTEVKEKEAISSKIGKETNEKIEKTIEDKSSSETNITHNSVVHKEANLTNTKSKVSLIKLSRIIYKRVLKSGEEGVSKKFLLEELSYDGYSVQEVEKTLRKLLKAKRLYQEDRRIYPIAKHKLEKARWVGGGLKKFKIYVEEIYPGKIIVLVNEKWRAVIPVEMNDELISLKKKSEYIVAGRLIHIEGKLHLRLHGIIKEL